jgi:poly [ADP-ribose] polymerase 2/3/4
MVRSKEYNSLQEAESLQQALELAIERSSLPKSVGKLMQLIFDFKMINEQMNQAGFDVKKSPLGKLAVTTIEKAFAVLNNMSEEIKKRSSDAVLENLSSQFYTLIPHNVGWKNMKSMNITTESQIKEKLELLESLRQIQIAYELVNTITLKPEDNPIDVNYRKLNCKIEPVDPSVTFSLHYNQTG